jgi:hypothetical protein
MTQEKTMTETNGSDIDGVAATEANPKPEDVTTADPVVGTKVNWNDSTMATTFANVVNVLVTREEVTLLFGMNQTWNAAEAKELTVQLNNRILLTPYAAKRLLTLLAARMHDYETRIGPITL